MTDKITQEVKRYCSRYAAGTESYRELTEWHGDPDEGTAYVLASDYDALREQFAERDAVRLHYEARINELKAEVAEAGRAGMRRASEICTEKGKHWQSMTPNVISPVACAAADCSDAILKEMK